MLPTETLISFCIIEMAELPPVTPTLTTQVSTTSASASSVVYPYEKPNPKDFADVGALHKAAVDGVEDSKYMTMMITHRNELNKIDKNGWTPIMLAAFHNKH